MHSSVCAVDADTHDFARLKSYETGDARVDNALTHCAIVEAARATAAAPTYFPTLRIGTNKFFDGAMKNNNPILELMKEIRGPLGNTNIKCIMSVGTGKSQHGPHQGGLIGMAKALVRLAVDTESKHEENMTDNAYEHVRDCYVRFNVEGGLGDVDLSRGDMLSQIKSMTRDFLGEYDTRTEIERAANLIAEGASALAREAERPLAQDDGPETLV